MLDIVNLSLVTGTLTKLVNDICLMMDLNATTVLLLLDPSAAFDTVDHNVLLNRLESLFGTSGLACAWLESYLSGRKQCVAYNDTYLFFFFEWCASRVCSRPSVIHNLYLSN